MMYYNYYHLFIIIFINAYICDPRATIFQEHTMKTYVNFQITYVFTGDRFSKNRTFSRTDIFGQNITNV